MGGNILINSQTFMKFALKNDFKECHRLYDLTNAQLRILKNKITKIFKT